MPKPRALVLTGYGINCDEETEYAFNLAGAEPEKVHIKQLRNRPRKLSDYQILLLPGGFLHADDISAGKVMANILRTELMDDIEGFIERGKLVGGICNGFQVLVKSGLLPGLNRNYKTQSVTLTHNERGRFEDRWVYLNVQDSACVWTTGLSSLYLPVRHGEGRFITKDDETLASLYDEGLVALKYVGENSEPEPGYPWNPNGSVGDIAGICDPTGRVFGLMPHPEAYVHYTQHPRWTRESLPEEGQGLQIFRNAVKYARDL